MGLSSQLIKSLKESHSQISANEAVQSTGSCTSTVKLNRKYPFNELDIVLTGPLLCLPPGPPGPLGLHGLDGLKGVKGDVGTRGKEEHRNLYFLLLTFSSQAHYFFCLVCVTNHFWGGQKHFFFKVY